jgi:hypothetical protein
VRFALFCKSFRGDLQRFEQLARSIAKYNVDNIPLIVSVPRADRALFAECLGTQPAQLLSDEEILGHEAKQGWITQQLVKLHFWRMDLADAWMWVDSDYYFFQPFRLSDFVDSAGRVGLVSTIQRHVLDDHWDQILSYLDGERGPRDVPAPDPPAPGGAARLASIPWYQSAWDALNKRSYVDRVPRIQAFFGRAGAPRCYMPSPIWTAECLRTFHTELLGSRGLELETVMRYSPWEAVWIGEWEHYRGMPQRFLVESYHLHIYKDETIRRARAAGLTEQRLSKRYLGLQLAERHQTLHSLDPG